MMLKKYAAGLLVLATFVLGAAWDPSPGYAANTIIQDDFSKDSKLWDMVGSATRTSDGKMMLTPSQQGQVGTIWLKQTLEPPYSVTYKFQMTGVDLWNEGADGIVFMFNKLQNKTPVSGGGMGFETGNGYGVEFDSYVNDWDPAYDHITLFKDNPNHKANDAITMQQVKDTSFENKQLHSVKVNVGTNNVKVYLDGTLKIDWNGTLSNKYSGLGFTASTGYYYNAQYIDDVVITKAAAVAGVTSSLADGSYTVGKVIPIEVKFNDAVTVSGTPQLALNTGRSASYVTVKDQDPSTLIFNYTVQSGDNTNLLNYSSASALTLNGGTITDSVGNLAELTLPMTSAPNSLGSSKSFKIDTAGPTGTITADAGNVLTTTATLNLTVSDAGTNVAQMRFSNDNATWSAWETYAAVKSYALPGGIGTKTVYAQFKDALGNVGSASVAMNPPTATGGFSTLNEDTPFTGIVGAGGADGRPIKQYAIVSNPSKGILSLNPANGQYTYTPNANVNGTDTFTYRVDDGIQYSAAATITLTINAVNDAPAAIAGTLNVVEDMTANGSLKATDIDSPSLMYSIVSQPGKGTIALNSANGSYTYTPNPNANGSDSFTFRASDGLLTSNTATVSVVITPVNDAPIATNRAYTTLEDSSISGTLSGSDADGDSLAFSIVSNGLKGTASITSSDFTYSPNPNVNGTDSFTYRAFDGTAYSAPATVTVAITPVNDTPSFTKGANQAAAQSSGTHIVPGWATNISAGSADEAGQAVHFTVSVDASGAALFTVPPAIAYDGALSYTLFNGVSGTAIVTVQLFDDGGTLNGGNDHSGTAVFTINISTSPITIGSITTSPAGWTPGTVEVTTSVYSSESIANQRWARAPGPLSVTDFTYDPGLGASFIGNSFLVNANGTYTVYFENVTGGNAVQTFDVTNIDTTVPHIALRPDAGNHVTMTVELGSVFVDPGADVTDDSLKTGITVTASSGVVNTSVVGTNLLSYQYTDVVGNTATVTRTVYVVDTTAPVIGLLGSNPMVVQVGSVFTDPGVTVTDASYSVSPSNVTVSGAVYTAAAGSYPLTYTVSDGSGNAAAPVTRTVDVIDTTLPTIVATQAAPSVLTKGTVTIVTYANGTGSPIAALKWAPEEHAVDYFTAGNGTPITGDSFTVASNGTYTVYAVDSSGNAAITTIDVANIDLTAPIGSVSINSGALTTATAAIQLQLNASDIGGSVAFMRISNTSGSWDQDWIAYDTEQAWTLPNGSGLKTVYVQFNDTVGNESGVYTASIVVDPNTPAVEQAVALLTEADLIADNTSLDQITQSLNLPSIGGSGTQIAWTSSRADVISAVYGTVKRPAYAQGNAFVALTAAVSLNGVSQTKTFNAIVLREPPSHEAALASLTANAEMLTPSFRPEVEKYQLTVANSVYEIQLSPILASPHATLSVTGAIYSDGVVSVTGLNPGSNPISITVTAEDGMTQMNYSIDAYREPNGSDNVPFGTEVSDDGNEIILTSIEPLDTNWTLKPSAFTIAGWPYVNSVAYDANDPLHRTVRLTLLSQLPANGTWRLTIDSGLRTVSGRIVSTSGVPIMTPAFKTQLIEALDLGLDGVHVNDLIGSFSGGAVKDMNGDGIADAYDVWLILSLLEPKSLK